MGNPKNVTDTSNHPYFKIFSGAFSGVLRWEQLDELWQRVRQDAGDWYIYAVGDAPPTSPASSEQLHQFIPEIDALLHKEHDEDYCGIVYADNREAPRFIKIFDPNNIGTSCSSGHHPPPLPGWILSKMKPIDLPNAFPQTGSRKRWWSTIFR